MLRGTLARLCTPKTPVSTHVRAGSLAPGMVDVSAKAATSREARAVGELFVPAAVHEAMLRSAHPGAAGAELARIAELKEIAAWKQRYEKGREEKKTEDSSSSSSPHLLEFCTKKGAVFTTATVAATMAVKQTSNLIPFCHPLAIRKCHIDWSFLTHVLLGNDGDFSNVLAVPICDVMQQPRCELEQKGPADAAVPAAAVWDFIERHPGELVSTRSAGLSSSSSQAPAAEQKTSKSSTMKTRNHVGPLRVSVSVRVGCEGVTGVEMEALSGASAALLTVYDMLKGVPGAVDGGMRIQRVQLLEKSGGKSGVWRYNDDGGGDSSW